MERESDSTGILAEFIFQKEKWALGLDYMLTPVLINVISAFILADQWH